MSDEPKKLDLIESRWQPVGVVSLEPNPKPARSLRNAAWDIGTEAVLTGALWGGIPFLVSRDRSFTIWLATCGGITGLVFGIRKWLSRPISPARG